MANSNGEVGVVAEGTPTKRGLFGGMRLFGGNAAPVKSKAELLEEEKRRQEALIQEQMQALQLETDLESERRRQDEFLQKARVEQKKRQGEEGNERKFQQEEQETEKRDEQKLQEEFELQTKKQIQLERQEELRRKQDLKGQQDLQKHQKDQEAKVAGDAAVASMTSNITLIDKHNAKAQQPSTTHKAGDIVDEEPVLSALERRRRQRQQASSSRPSIRGGPARDTLAASSAFERPEDKNEKQDKNRATQSNAKQDDNDQSDSEENGAAMAAIAPTSPRQASPQHKTRTSRPSRLFKRPSSGTIAMPPTTDGSSTMSHQQSASPADETSLDQRRIDWASVPMSKPANVSFSQDILSSSILTKSDALAAHLEAQRRKSINDQTKNRHGDEVSLGTMMFQQQLKSPNTPPKGSPKEHLFQESSAEIVPPTRDERPWESASVTELLKKQKTAKKKASTKVLSSFIPKTESDEVFLDENNSVFQKSVFGLLTTAEDDDRANFDHGGKEGDVGVDSDDRAGVDSDEPNDQVEQALQFNENGKGMGQRGYQNSETDFEDTWDQAETDHRFIAELKQLKAKQSSNHYSRQGKINSSIVETEKERIKRLRLFDKEKQRGKKTKKGKKPVFSKEFREAMDAVFSSDNEDEYTVNFNTRVVENLPRDLGQRQNRPTQDNTESEGEEDNDDPDGSCPATAVDSILKRLRDRSIPSDDQSLRSRRTTRSQATDTLSRRSAKSSRTGTTQSSRTSSRSRRRTLSRASEAKNILKQLQERSMPSGSHSLRSNRTSQSHAADAESRRTRTSSRTETTQSSKPSSRNRNRERTPSWPSDPVARRRDQSSDQSTRSGVSSTSTMSRPRSKSTSENPNEGTPPKRRALRAARYIRANSADASQVSEVAKPRSSPQRRPASTGRPRTHTPTGRGAKRNDNFSSCDITLGSRTVRSVRSARSWNVGGASSTDPAEFYQREMQRLKNKTFSTSGFQKEMVELRRKKNSSSPTRLNLPTAPKRRHTAASPFQTDFYGSSRQQLDNQAPHNILSPLRNTDEASQVRDTGNNVFMNGFGGVNEENEDNNTSAKRFPRMRRALFRGPASTKVEENQERLL